jgi:hypothetical protein
LRETETDGGDGVYGGAPLGVAVLVAATAMSCNTPTHHIHLSEYEQEELQLQAENLFSSVAVGSDWSGSDGSGCNDPLGINYEFLSINLQKGRNSRSNLGIKWIY